MIVMKSSVANSVDASENIIDVVENGFAYFGGFDAAAVASEECDAQFAL